MARTKTERDTALEVISTWHLRAQREVATARSTSEMRDYEVWQAVYEHKLTVKDVSAKLGLTHQAIYKMLKRGSAYKMPPLPF